MENRLFVKKLKKEINDLYNKFFRVIRKNNLKEENGDDINFNNYENIINESIEYMSKCLKKEENKDYNKLNILNKMLEKKIKYL